MHTVEEAMTADVVTIAPDETVAAAARMMSDGGVSGLPVIDPNGRVMGLITETDLFDLARVPDPGRLGDDAVGRRRPPATVREVMSRDVVGICPDAPLSEATRLMEAEHVKRLVVFGPGFELKGIISRSDVIAALDRPDPDIAEAGDLF